MHVRAATSMAVLAYAATSQAAAAAKPYPLAMMPVLGKSLMSRSTNGYIPDQSHCNEGSDCASACGAEYVQCGSKDGLAHCFNPAAKQSCCPDGSGNSCEAGYYCTNDHKKQTWCCPEDMDLAACAAAYTIPGGLKMIELTTSKESTTSAPTTTAPTTTIAPTTIAQNTTTVVETESTTICPVTSAGHTTAWTGSNSTVTSAVMTQPADTGVPPPVTAAPSEVPPGNAASASSVSGLLLAVAGLVALL